MSQDSLLVDTILQKLYQSKQIKAAQRQQLIEVELADAQRSNALGITVANCQQKITERIELFVSLVDQVWGFCQQLGFKNIESVLILLWNLWLPLAIQLTAEQSELGRTIIQGILGGQGTGKSTLAAVLKLILNYLNYSTVTISIDDLYKTYSDRLKLQAEDSRLIWRGPPGTHDVELGITVLEQCLQANNNESILIPRFDKSAYNGAGDRAIPETVTKPDIVILEGWFVGVHPISENNFDSPPPPIVTAADKQFAIDNNRRLRDYLPLWSKLDRLIVFNPVDYRLSQQWRKEAEHKMIATGKTGMTDAQIDEFVEYFWLALHPELLITPLINNSQLTDLVIEINRDRTYGRIYQPN
ncbi:MAG: glycerate kinase [Pleurocapsa sp.]